MSFHPSIAGTGLDSESIAHSNEAVCPIVSIGMPIFNCEKTVTTAIRSILNQTFKDWELLLVDDGSKDRTLEVAHSFRDSRISVVTDHAHRGIAYRLNQAIELSRGIYFARMDSDDVAYPDRLALQVEYLKKHPKIDLLGCAMLVFKSDGRVVGIRPAPETHEQICRRPSSGFLIGHPTWIGYTSWFRRHRYRLEAIRTEDQDLLLRTFQTSQFAALGEILLGYREDSLSFKKILTGRLHFTGSRFRDAISSDQYFGAAACILEQLSKTAIEAIAVGTGLDYALLWHRAFPADEVAKKKWSQLWSEMITQHE